MQNQPNQDQQQGAAGPRPGGPSNGYDQAQGVGNGYDRPQGPSNGYEQAQGTNNGYDQPPGTVFWPSTDYARSRMHERGFRTERNGTVVQLPTQRTSLELFNPALFLLDTDPPTFTLVHIVNMCEDMLSRCKFKKLAKFLQSLPEEDEVQKNETVLKARVTLAYHTGDFRAVYELIKDNVFSPENHARMQWLWFNAHYREAEELRAGKPLCNVGRCRVRAKYPSPSTIWDGEPISYTFKVKTRKMLTSFYRRCPLPSTQQKTDLSNKCELTLIQVSNWFKNRRQRERDTGPGSPSPDLPEVMMPPPMTDGNDPGAGPSHAPDYPPPHQHQLQPYQQGGGNNMYQQYQQFPPTANTHQQWQPAPNYYDPSVPQTSDAQQAQYMGTHPYPPAHMQQPAAIPPPQNTQMQTVLPALPMGGQQYPPPPPHITQQPPNVQAPNPTYTQLQPATMADQHLAGTMPQQAPHAMMAPQAPNVQAPNPTYTQLQPATMAGQQQAGTMPQQAPHAMMAPQAPNVQQANMMPPLVHDQGGVAMGYQQPQNAAMNHAATGNQATYGYPQGMYGQPPQPVQQFVPTPHYQDQQQQQHQPQQQ